MLLSSLAEHSNTLTLLCCCDRFGYSRRYRKMWIQQKKKKEKWVPNTLSYRFCFSKRSMEKRSKSTTCDRHATPIESILWRFAAKFNHRKTVSVTNCTDTDTMENLIAKFLIIEVCRIGDNHLCYVCIYYRWGVSPSIYHFGCYSLDSLWNIFASAPRNVTCIPLFFN